MLKQHIIMCMLGFIDHSRLQMQNFPHKFWLLFFFLLLTTVICISNTSKYMFMLLWIYYTLMYGRKHLVFIKYFAALNYCSIKIFLTSLNIAISLFRASKFLAKKQSRKFCILKQILLHLQSIALGFLMMVGLGSYFLYFPTYIFLSSEK